MRSPSLVVLGLGSLILSHTTARSTSAALLSWNNAAGGTASTAGNWNPAQIPVPADDLTFNLLATYNVTFNASVVSSDSHTYKRGTVAVTATSPHTIGGGGLHVGDTNLDLASMVLATGTMNVGASSFVGVDAGSTGTLTVNDDDADLIFTGAATDFTVGNNGTATLNILGGGRVVVPDQFLLGSNAASIANLTVSGATSSLPLSRSTLEVTGVSQSRMGQGGDATVNISNGALAIFDGDVVVSNGSASTSSVTIAGIGGILPQNATLNVAGDLMLGNNGNAVAAGVATLNVNADGLVLVNDTLVVAGDPQGGSATLHVTDGGEVNATNMTIGDGATLDLDGGEVRIDGGVLTYTDPSISFEFGGVDHPVIALINGATANFAPTTGTTAMTVGGVPGSPFADFDVRSGSDLTISGNGDLHIGGGAPDDAAMTITGVGSSLTLNTNSGMLVGRLGTGTFNAELGATVTGPSIQIAPFGGTTGEAQFSNPGTTADFISIRVGGNNASQGGDGDLYINAGAVVDATHVHSWPSGAVKIAASTLDIEQDFTSQGLLETHSNAVLNVGGLLRLEGDLISHPDFAGGVATITGKVQVEPGSTITLDLGDLTLGDAKHVNGFGAMDDTLIAVGANTLTLLDANGAVVDDVTINGGHIIAPGGLEFITPLAQDSTLTGTGTITTGELFVENGNSIVTATGAAGIVINGKLRNNSSVLDGTKYTFNNNPEIDDSGWTGAGTIDAQVVFNSGTQVNALANMTMGDNSNFGVTFNAGSELHADFGTVSLLDTNGVALPSITDVDDGTIVCPAQLVVNNTRVMRGHGEIDAPVLIVNAGGQLKPGDFTEPGTGQLTLLGDLDLNTNAITEIHVRNAPATEQFDRIVADAVDLQGELRVRMLDGFSPAVGTVYTIIDGTSMTGAFASLSLERPGPGNNWRVTYTGAPLHRVNITVNTCVADTTHDGQIDIDDLLAVIGTWGACPGGDNICIADIAPFIADGQVNIDDLLAVIGGWGNCS